MRGRVPIDALLVLMVVIWGSNYSVIKRCFEAIPPHAFNAIRLVIASTIFQIGIRAAARRARRGPATVPSIFYTRESVTAREWLGFVALGLVGHLGYQYCFVSGIDATSVSNAALIIGATPAVVAVASAVLGHDRVTPFHWAGAAVSALGLYLVVGREASFGGEGFRGDLFMMASVCCWAAYTLGAARLMTRHSPLYVTGTTMSIGAVPYAILAWPQIVRVPWVDVPSWMLAALVGSALLALCLSYLIWYTAVKRIGPARTSIYSNMVPIVAMTVAGLWLGESIGAAKIAGAVAVIGGVLVTRIGRTQADVPVEE